MIWTQDELIQLSGYKQKSKVAGWLRDNGVAFLIGRDGWPRVLKSTGLNTSKTLTKSEPNFAALTERQNGAPKKNAKRPT